MIISIYVNRRAALLASARMNTAQVERAHAQRRTLQSGLQALQARVEPQFLFSVLAQVRDLFDRDPVRGNEMLGDLIVYLRAALPLLRDSMSTLEQELTLVRAYLSIVRVQLAKPLTFDIRVAQPELAAPVPPMVLLPLLDRALANALSSSATDIAISVAAKSSVGRLRVEITYSGSCFAAKGHDGSLCAIRDRLSGMYGDSGSLMFKTTINHDTQAVMEIPHESTDSSHR
jgi:LytS/YehU family sensor histidine kinase